MALANRYVVLYFTPGPVPTAEQLAEARMYGPHVLFRNTRFIKDGEGFEPCTAVAGEVPAHYARKYPEAVSYMDWLQGKLPVTEPDAPAAGEIAMGADTRSIASRIIDPDKPQRPKRSKQANAGAAAGAEPQEGMTGTISLPPPPPPPTAPGGPSLTGEISLPPPPPEE